MSVLENEVAFLLGVTSLLESGAAVFAADAPELSSTLTDQLSSSERAVLAELRLLEKSELDYAPSGQAAAAAAPAAELATLLAESPLAATYTGETVSPYTRFLLSFYSSALYTKLPTKVNTAAVRLFQRFLCTCRAEALGYLQLCCRSNTMEVVLCECLNLAGNIASTVEAVPPSTFTGLVLGELGYDAYEVSPLDYLDVFLPHIPYLSQMCQQASLLLLAHEEMVRQPSSVVALLTVLFTIRNMSQTEEEVHNIMSGWSVERQDTFARMNAFLNCFT